MVPKSKSFQIYLEISTPVNLESLSTKLTLTFLDFTSKIYLGKNGPKFKTLPDLLENLHSRNLEGVECRFNMNILGYFIQNLNLDKLILKLKSRGIYLLKLREYVILHLNLHLQVNTQIYVNICTLDNLKIANANTTIK